MNSEEMRAAIEPKSDQINADDLITGPLTVTVRQVKRGPSQEQPVEIVIDGHRPYRPCKSMRRVLIACWGDNGADWVGRSMTLFSDPSVRYGGVAVGGVRISHVSHIERDISLLLTTMRSKRAEYVVRRLDAAPRPYPQDAFEKNAQAWVTAIAGGKLSLPDVITKAAKTGVLTSEQIAQLEAMTKQKDATKQPESEFNRICAGIERAANQEEIDEWQDYIRQVEITPALRDRINALAEERARQIKSGG